MVDLGAQDKIAKKKEFLVKKEKTPEELEMDVRKKTLLLLGTTFLLPIIVTVIGVLYFL